MNPTEKVFHIKIMDELEMQRRALVSLKTQRDIDRKRRLQFIMRVKKERDQQNQANKNTRMLMYVSLALSALAFITLLIK